MNGRACPVLPMDPLWSLPPLIRGIFISTDFGETWTDVAPSVGTGDWRAATCSLDGKTLFAGIHEGSIYVSKDLGLSWSEMDTGAFWTGVALSGDASKIAVCAQRDVIYTSDDGGTTWIPREGSGERSSELY